MTIHSICCCLLALLHVFNPIGGSLRRIQYRGDRLDGNARAIARCAKAVTSALFEPSNSVVVIVPENSTLNNDSSLTDDLLRTLANDDNIYNAVSVVNDAGFRLHVLDRNWQRHDRDSSYVIMENHPDNLNKIFETKITPEWSEYLIVTRVAEDSLRSFASSMWRRDFLRLAFLHVQNERELVLRTFDVSSRNSSNSNEPAMKSVAVCGDNFSKLDVHLRPFSSILCPAKGCYLTVGHVNNDMVGSAPVAESRRVFDSADRIVSVFVDRYEIELRNRSNDVGNWTENLDLIRRDEIELIYGSFIPRVEGSEFLEIATWFAFEAVIFVDVTQYTVLAPLTKIFFPLDGYVWLCLIISLVLYSMFALIVEKARERKLVAEAVTYFDIWAILLGQGVRNPFKIGLRIVLGMWMLASLLINAAYGCAFKSSLASFTRIETLKTIADINNSGRRIAGTEVARELFDNSDDEADLEIYARWKIVRADEVFPVVMQERIVGVDYALNVKLHNLLHRGRLQPSLYTLEDPILVYPLNFYLKKRHPYVKHFRKLVVRARAAGLFEKWNVDDFNDVKQLASRKQAGRFRWNGVMTIRHLKVAFKLWGYGNLIALIVFFYELCKSGRWFDRMRPNSEQTATA